MADRTLSQRLRLYRVLLASRARAQMQYRASFVTDILGTVGVGLAEFAEVWVIFHNVDVLGGLDFTAALLVFALSNLAFSLADTAAATSGPARSTRSTYVRCRCSPS